MNSPFFERYFKAKLKREQPQLLKETREQGLQQGREQGREQGLQQGLQQGAILALLEVRLGKVPQTIRGRVAAESRLRVLASWHKAAQAATDAPSARKLLARIRAAAPPPARAA